MRFLFAILTVVCFTSCGFLSSDDETYRDLTDTKVKGGTLYISGTLNAQTYDEVKKIIDTHPQLHTVVLQEIDGSIDDDINLETGLLIHRAGLRTYVPKDGVIESGAVDLFCAGKQRIAERGAHVGVHAWEEYDDSDGDETVFASGDNVSKDSPEHDMYLDYFREVGCPESFYWFTLQAASADGMHIMTEKELVEQGVVTQMID